MSNIVNVRGSAISDSLVVSYRIKWMVSGQSRGWSVVSLVSVVGCF